MLYIAMGDGGSGGDPEGNGQRLDTLLGKILRIDVKGPDATAAAPYAAPVDNPYFGIAEALPEIWLSGLRNPWRIRFDDPTGDLWIGDVGQGPVEEIDVIRAGTGRPEPGLEHDGRHTLLRRPTPARPRADAADHPVRATASAARSSVGSSCTTRRCQASTGGTCSATTAPGTLWTIDPAGDDLQRADVVLESGRGISSISTDEDGTILVTDLSGALFRVVSAP